MIRVGPAGWSYPDWDGVVYPKPKPKGFSPLGYLSRFVNCVELNSSFYAFPRAHNANLWLRQTSDHVEFRFVAKLHRSFTHAPLDTTFDHHRSLFLEGLRPLGPRMSALLVQFPNSFHCTASSQVHLERILEAFYQYPLVLELRHRSWFERDKLHWLERSRFSLAAIDLPPSHTHPPEDSPTLGPIGYLRLHGRNAAAWFDRQGTRDRRYDYLYGPDEVEQLVRRAHKIAARTDDTYVVANNHFSGKAVANALEIQSALSGEVVSTPPELLEYFPRLSAIARATAQRTLF